MAHTNQTAPGLPPETVTLPARGWRIDPRHALIAAAVCWIGFALMVWAVETGRTSGLDDAGLRLWRFGPDFAPRGPLWLLEMVRDLTALGGVLLRSLFAIMALAALLFLRLRREAVLLAATLMSGWIVETMIKLAVGRPRPEIVSHLTAAGGASFPSGHSFNSALGNIAVALAFAALSSRRDVRWTLIGSAAALSMLIAWSRVLLGVHYPSDVIAGWLGGAAWAFTASTLLYRPANAVAKQAKAEIKAVTPRGSGA